MRLFFQKIGIYLLAFLLPWQTRYIFHYGTLNNGDWEYGTMALYGIDILILIMLLFALIGKISQKGFWQDFKKPYWIPIGILFAISILSSFFAIDPRLAWYRVGQLFLGIVIFYIISTENQISKIKIFFWLILGAGIQAIIASWQFLTQIALGNKWLGMASHLPGNLGVSVIQADNPLSGLTERWLRAYGSLDHPNLLGGLLAITLLIAIYLIVKRDHGSKQSTGQDQNPISINTFLIKCQPMIFTCLIIITAGIFFSFSRTAWIALCVGVIIMIIMLIKDFKKILPAIIPIMIIFGILGYQHYYLITARADVNENLEYKSVAERIEYTKNTVQILEKNWLLGVGPGNYGLAVQKYIAPDKTNWYYQPVHNVFLLIVSETGIIGLLAFIWLLLALIIINIKKMLSKTNDLFPLLNITLLVALIIMMFFDHWLWSLHFGTVLLWLTLGISVKPDQQLPENL